MRNKFVPVCLSACFLTMSCFAQNIATDSLAKPKPKKFYVGSGMDGAIFSTAGIQDPAADNTMGTIRFSYVINWGVTFNWNLGRIFGLYTGTDIKNIGYIDNEYGFIVKRRTYNIGVPVGIKIGNMLPGGMFAFLGGGADVPFNYREKRFQVRNQKMKFSEWFSDRTPSVMPYVFAGASVYRGLSLKFQYYPGNFFNTSYIQNSVKPYAAKTVHIMFMSIGYTVPLGTHDMIKKRLEDMKVDKKG